MSLINDALKRANEQKAKPPTAAELGSSMQSVDGSAGETKLWPIGLFALVMVGSLWFGLNGWMRGSANRNTNTAQSMAPVDVAARTAAPTSTEAPESTGLPAAASSEETPAATQEASTAQTESQLDPVSAPALAQRPISSVQSQTANPRSSSASTTPKSAAPTLATTTPAAAAKTPGVNSATASSESVATGTSRENALSNPSTASSAAPAANAGTVSSVSSRATAATAATAAQEPPANTFPRLVLQGIYYRPARPSAVINSKTVYIGDRVSQAKVLSIDRHEVTVQWNNEVHVLAFQ